jgi:hypothetical protein
MWKLLAITAVVMLIASSHAGRPSMDRDEALNHFATDVLELELGIRHALRDSARTDSGLLKLAERIGVRFNPDLEGVRDEDIVIALWGRTGNDDRRDMETVRNEAVRRNGEAVCAIIETNKLHFNSSDETWVFDKFRNLCEAKGLCAGEFFENQPVVAYGTAFLVKDSIIATAAHTVINLGLNLDSFAVVFDYETENGVATTQFEASQVFHAVEIIACRRDTVADWALLRLDRSPRRPPLTLNCSDTREVGDSLYMIGHGEGLPLKYSDGAAVTAWPHTRYFNASVDAFNHDSGAPVFNWGTHCVEGLVTRARIDYVKVPGRSCVEGRSICRRPFRFGDDPRCHATVVPVSEFAHWLDPDSCRHTPPPSASCASSQQIDEFYVVIAVDADYAVIQLDCGPPRLVTPETDIDPVPVMFTLGKVLLLNCDENGCRWVSHQVEAGRHYKIKDASPRDVKPGEKRWLHVTLTEMNDDR